MSFLFSPGFYWYSSISWPGLKLLAVRIWCDIEFSMSKFAKGNCSKKQFFFFFNFSPGNLLIILYKLIKFKAPSCYRLWNILIRTFHYDPLKGALLHKRRSSRLKNMGQLLFDEENIYGISKLYRKLWTDRRTDGQAQSNMSLQHFQSWRHNNL